MIAIAQSEHPAADVRDRFDVAARPVAIELSTLRSSSTAGQNNVCWRIRSRFRARMGQTRIWARTGAATRPGRETRFSVPAGRCARAIAIINEMSRSLPPSRAAVRTAPTGRGGSRGPRKPPARRASVGHGLSEATIPVGTRLTTTSYLKMYDRRLWRPPLRNGEALRGAAGELEGVQEPR